MRKAPEEVPVMRTWRKKGSPVQPHGFLKAFGLQGFRFWGKMILEFRFSWIGLVSRSGFNGSRFTDLNDVLSGSGFTGRGSGHEGVASAVEGLG